MAALSGFLLLLIKNLVFIERKINILCSNNFSTLQNIMFTHQILENSAITYTIKKLTPELENQSYLDGPAAARGLV